MPRNAGSVPRNSAKLPDEDRLPNERKTEPDRSARRKPRAHASNDAGDEPGKAWRSAWAFLPAGPEIRKGKNPDQRQPSPAPITSPSGEVPHFFEGSPGAATAGMAETPSYVTEFLATSDGLALLKAFIR